MEKYKRYTERTCYYDSIPFSIKPVRLLQELENKIEDGILVELPCAIGAPIWKLDFIKEDPCAWCQHDHSGFGDTICDLYDSEYPDVEDWINGEEVCPQFELTYYETTFQWRDMNRLKWLDITWFTDINKAKEALKTLSKIWDNQKQKSDS